jgi:hypothetical protein
LIDSAAGELRARVMYLSLVLYALSKCMLYYISRLFITNVSLV